MLRLAAPNPVKKGDAGRRDQIKRREGEWKSSATLHFDEIGWRLPIWACAINALNSLARCRSGPRRALYSGGGIH
jgi:hypothetical protein